MGHPGPCQILRVKGQAKPQPHVWRLWRVPWGPEQGGDKADPLSETWARTPTHLFPLPSTTPEIFLSPKPFLGTLGQCTAAYPTSPHGNSGFCFQVAQVDRGSPSPPLSLTNPPPNPSERAKAPVKPHSESPHFLPPPASALVQAPSLLTQVFLFTALRPPEVSFQLREKARVP